MSVIVEPGRTFLDNSGRVLSSGTVTFYVAGQTVTKISIFATAAHQAAGTPALSNPQTLNSAGRLATQVHAAGPCRMIVKNSTGATILDEDNVVTTDYTALTQSVLGGIFYPTSAYETLYSAPPTDKTYDYGDVRRYGAVDGAANSTSGFQTAALVAPYHGNYWPAGTWNISGVTLPAGSNVRTEGFATSLVQLAGYDGSPNTLTRLVKISSSNVTLGSLTVTGKIATDSSEFNHLVCVEASSASISNITLGDIRAIDARGDGLYIGGTSGYTVTNVRFGRVTGENILRNIVSITNGVSDVQGVGIRQAGACGYAALDIEPDTDPSTDIDIGYVYGRFLQIAPTLAADYANRIRIGVVDLDPAYGGNTTPTYGSAILDIGLQTRNCRHFYIGSATIKNFPQFAWNQVFNVGELADQRAHFGHLEISGCGATESTYNAACQVINMDFIKVDSGVFSLQAVGDYVFYGNNVSGTQFDLSNITCDGTLVRYADASRISNVLINTANATPAFRDVTNSTIENSNITIPTLLNTGANVTLARVDATCSTAFLAGTVTDITPENCSGGAAGISSPAQITSNQNDYAVGQLVTHLRISTDVSRNITGITNGRQGRELRVFNVGSADAVLVNESASSTAANRIALGADLTIGAGEGATLWYDSTSSRWRCASRV